MWFPYLSLLCQKTQPRFPWSKKRNLLRECQWRMLLRIEDKYLAALCVLPRAGKGAKFGEVSFPMSHFQSIAMQRYLCKNANKNRPQIHCKRFLFLGPNLMVIADIWRFIKQSRDSELGQNLHGTFYRLFAFICHTNPARQVIRFLFTYGKTES